MLEGGRVFRGGDFDAKAAAEEAMLDDWFSAFGLLRRGGGGFGALFVLVFAGFKSFTSLIDRSGRAGGML